MNNHLSAPWQNGRGGFEKLVLTTTNGASTELYRHGAHVTSWRTAKGREWIFTSERAQFAEGKAIRGGVPIIFPQFNAFGSGPRHGFARNLPWQLSQSPGPVGEHSRCALSLRSDATTKAAWTYAFETEFVVELTDNQLRMTLQVKNTDVKPFQFTAALHTYLAVTDINNTRLLGVGGLSYWDNDGSDFQQRQTAVEDELGFSDAFDRVYFNSQKPLTLCDGEDYLAIASEGFKEVVVWNPGAEEARNMTDMAEHEYRKMLCVEAAIIDRPISLAPGESWLGRQILTA